MVAQREVLQVYIAYPATSSPSALDVEIRPEFRRLS
jgi:hypothetical protein